MGRVVMHNKAFNELRKAPKLQALLRIKGDVAAEELNAELAVAQEKRGQPEEPGYASAVVAGPGHTRARLYIWAGSARAQAHEKEHNSLERWAFRNGGKTPKGKG